MEWIELLKALGFAAAIQILILIAVGFFGRKIIEYFFDKTVEIKKILSQQGYCNQNPAFDIDKDD